MSYLKYSKVTETPTADCVLAEVTHCPDGAEYVSAPGVKRPCLKSTQRAHGCSKRTGGQVIIITSFRA